MVSQGVTFSATTKTDCRFTDNVGFVTEAHGNATITGGNQAVIAHGLSGTPQSIIVTMRNTTDDTSQPFYLYDIDGTNFIVQQSSYVTGNYAVYWEAFYYP